MPKLTDPEPIIIDGKVVYDNEFARVKAFYFEPDDDESRERLQKRKQNSINQAR